MSCKTVIRTQPTRARPEHSVTINIKHRQGHIKGLPANSMPSVTNSPVFRTTHFNFWNTFCTALCGFSKSGLYGGVFGSSTPFPVSEYLSHDSWIGLARTTCSTHTLLLAIAFTSTPFLVNGSPPLLGCHLLIPWSSDQILPHSHRNHVAWP